MTCQKKMPEEKLWGAWLISFTVSIRNKGVLIAKVVIYMSNFHLPFLLHSNDVQYRVTMQCWLIEQQPPHTWPAPPQKEGKEKERKKQTNKTKPDKANIHAVVQRLTSWLYVKFFRFVDLLHNYSDMMVTIFKKEGKFWYVNIFKCCVSVLISFALFNLP